MTAPDMSTLRQELAKVLWLDAVPTIESYLLEGISWESIPWEYRRGALACLPTVVQALADAAEQMRESVYIDVRALPGYVDHGKGTSGFEIGDNSRVDVLREIRATPNPFASSGDTTNGED